MQRVQKLLAQIGIGSRRQIESWIIAGRLLVAGKQAFLGLKVTGKEEYRLDGKILPLPVNIMAVEKENVNLVTKSNKYPQVLIYHKPVGRICSRSDPQGRPTIFMDLPKLIIGRWIAVGRLDLNTAGLMLFTDCGALAHKLMHPSTGLEREYIVRVYGTLTPEMLTKLRQGVDLGDGLGVVRVNKISLLRANKANTWYKVILTEGKNREIKRLFAAVGFMVNRLIRIRFGTISLPYDLKPGEFRSLRNFTL